MIENSDIRIEQASIDDRSVLIELFYELLQYMDPFDCLILPTRENAIFYADHIFIPAASTQDPILIAWHDSKPVGFCCMTTPQPPYQLRWRLGIFWAYFVREAYRGCKIGLKMFQMGCQRLKELKIERVAIEPYLNNLETMKFYRKMGFVTIGEIATLTL